MACSIFSPFPFSFTVHYTMSKPRMLLVLAYPGCPGENELLLFGLLTKQNSHPKFVNSVVIFMKLKLFLYIKQ